MGSHHQPCSSRQEARRSHGPLLLRLHAEAWGFTATVHGWWRGWGAFPPSSASHWSQTPLLLGHSHHMARGIGHTSERLCDRLSIRSPLCHVFWGWEGSEASVSHTYENKYSSRESPFSGEHTARAQIFTFCCSKIRGGKKHLQPKKILQFSVNFGWQLFAVRINL